MLIIGPDKPTGSKSHLTNTGINIKTIYLPSSVLHELHCLSHNLTWSAKPALYRKADQAAMPVNATMHG